MKKQEDIIDLIVGELNKKLEGKIDDTEMYELGMQIYFVLKGDEKLWQ